MYYLFNIYEEKKRKTDRMIQQNYAAVKELFLFE